MWRRNEAARQWIDPSGRIITDLEMLSGRRPKMREKISITSEQATALAAGEAVDFDFEVRGPDFAQDGQTESLSFTLVPPEATSTVLQLEGDAGLEGKVRAKLSDSLDGIMAGDAASQPAAEALGRILVSLATARILAETADLGVHVHNYGADEINNPQG